MQTNIKICGIQRPALVRDIAGLGVDYIGLVFHKASRRHVDMVSARQIVWAANDAGVTPVAVFVHQSAEEMHTICHTLGINVIQLHGDISRAQHPLLSEKIIRIYALSIDNQGDIIHPDKQTYDKLHPEKDWLLFDGPQGGSGRTILTHKLQQLTGSFRFFIAGGLTPMNVGKAIARCRPFAVDVSSGVEYTKGGKDISLIKQFVEQVKTGVLSYEY